MNILIFLLAGFGSGILAGMGMGGGNILIPALTLLAGMGQQAAQGVNMLAFLPGALLALCIHRKEGRVKFAHSWPMIAWGAGGAVLGALCALWLPADWLRRLFGGFLVLLSIVQFRNGERRAKQADKNPEDPVR